MRPRTLWPLAAALLLAIAALGTQPAAPPPRRRRVVFIVPERDRALQYDVLRTLLLARPALCDMDVLLVRAEQARDAPFNRGMLANAGFAAAMEAWPDATRVVLHDADMLPESSVCYRTPEGAAVVLFATRISQYEYAMPYDTYFGGVVAFHPHAYRLADGFRNEFWGWGGEDDDMRERVRRAGLAASHGEGGRFLCFNHSRPVVKEQYAHNLALLGVGKRRPARRPAATTGLRNLSHVAHFTAVRVADNELHVVVTPRRVPTFPKG